MTGRHAERKRAVPDFAQRASSYDVLRPADDAWWQLYDVLVREGDLRGRRVLDIGCGTGQFAAALGEHARVWAVDAEPEMVAVARGRVRAVRVARAEELPFKDGWFERAVMRQVVHLVDRPRAFAEARRVLGADGRLVIATFAEQHFDTVWLAPLFPKM